MVRGASKLTLMSSLNEGESVIHLDLKTDLVKSEFGGRTVLAVARCFDPTEIVIEGESNDKPFIEDLEEVEQNATKKPSYYAEALKTKETPCLVSFVHNAREYFGLLHRPTAIHVDRERGLHSSAVWKLYQELRGVRCLYGIPNESNSNAIAEAAIRVIAETSGATLIAAGMSEGYWPWSSRTVAMNMGTPKGVNTVPRERVFGQHGVLASAIRHNHRVLQRGTHVSFLTYDVQSSGGVIVLYKDDQEQYRQAIVADRHVRWYRQFSFRSVRDGLTETRGIPCQQLQQLQVDLEAGQRGPLAADLAPLTAAERRIASTRVDCVMGNVVAKELLEEIKQWDSSHGGIFAKHPTQGESAEVQALYLEEVTNPLWIERLEAKLAQKRYQLVNELWKDAKLMSRNCWTFNQINSSYWKNAKAFSKFLDEIRLSLGSKLSLPVGNETAHPEPIADVLEAHLARTKARARRQKKKRERQRRAARDATPNQGLFTASERCHRRRPPAGNRSTRRTRQRQLRGLVARLSCMLTQQLSDELLESALPDASLPLGFVPPRALLTRKCTKSEAASEAGQFAVTDELRKVCLLQGIAEPVLEREAAEEPDATISSVCMLQSIKHAEREAAKQKYKGRLVLLGDRITSLLTGQPVSPTGEQYGLSGELTSLDGVRVILAHHLMLKAKGDTTAVLEKADITSAYLQALWPAHIPPHFLRLPSDVWRGLPDELRAKADALRSKGRVCFRMRTCLYGHPISGHAWISKCDLHLKETGWTPVEGVPAVYQRKSCLIAVYVDDVIASGAKAEIDQFWSELQGKFGSGASASNLTFEPEAAKEFLGADFEIIEKDNSFELTISMKDYAREVWETYERTRDNTNVRINNASVPIADELSHESEVVAPSRRVQKLIGMMLWVARNSRPDTALAVSRLGTQVCRWNSRSERELQRLCKYIYETREYGICMHMPKGARPEDLELVTYSDANLGEPTSQSGAFLALMGRAGTAGEGAFCPLTWRSKRQPLTLDSSGATEMVAAHYAVRELLECVHSLTRTLGLAHDDPPMKLLVDNSTVLRNSRRGDSPSLGYLRLTARLRLGMLKDLQDLGLLRVGYVKSADNLADAFTKVLGRIAFERARSSIGVRRIS